MDRRVFLRRAGSVGLVMGMGSGFWDRAFAQAASPVQPVPSPYGELQPPDANGLMLPPGFTSRVVAASFLPVADTGFVWHPFPDGGACVPTDDGGWIYVSNSENPPPVDVPGLTGILAALHAASATAGVPVPTAGGVGAIRFAADGSVVDAYRILDGSQSNCAGGLTPWGTWLSCEEWESDGATYEAGKVWECDPFGAAAAIDRPSLGRFKHEMAACDPVRQQIYLSEDQADGLFYRYTPPAGTWGSGAALDGGVLEAMVVAPDDSVSWLPVPDASAPTAPLRHAVAGATPFVSGEGVIYDDDRVYLTCKPPADQVWCYDLAAGTIRVLYDATTFAAPVLDGVDNIIASAAHDLYVAEDGGNLEVCVITPELGVFPIARMTGGQHGIDSGTPVPTLSEVTGLALSPDGNRLYFNSERGNGIVPLGIGPGPGILYEVTGPFRGGTLAAATVDDPTVPVAPAPGPSAVPNPSTGGVTLPNTGGGGALGVGAATAAAALAARALVRRRDGVASIRPEPEPPA